MEEQDRNTIKKSVNFVFFWLIIYSFLTMIIGMIAGVCGLPYGLESIISTLPVCALVYLCTFKKHPTQAFAINKKMNSHDFVVIFGLLGICQVLTYFIMKAVTALGAQGTEIPISKNTIYMVIYAGFTGPLVEELMYRGFTAGNLKQHGKIYAIVISSLAFGLMHGNLTQFIVAFMAGAVLAYVALEYSIWWSIVFHIINNFVMSTLPELLFPNTSEATLDMVVYGIYGVFGIYAIADLIKNKNKIKEFFENKDNHAPKGCIKQTLKSFSFILFVLIYVGLIVLLMLVPDITAMAAAYGV